MKKQYIFFLLISICLVNCGQGGDIQQKRKTGTDTTYEISDSSMFKPRSNDPLVNLINSFADSINNAAKSGVLPVFLSDAQLDYRKASFSILHQPAPLRKLIFDRVTNCLSLKLILFSRDSSYRIHPKRQDGIDVKYLEYSMWDFAIKRFKELKCKGNSI